MKLGTWIFLLALTPLAANAQSNSIPLDEVKKEVKDSTPAAEQPAQKSDVERIEVTGSHIKRLDTEGASPVTTITRKELDKSGYTSVSDVLRDTGMNSFGSQRESSNSGAPAGNAEVSLRGLGSDNTLVLLNGQRLPTDAVTGAVDLNLIPMAAVERIEVLKDGASAIYGSDALGGVVNIITRKDFQGTEVSVEQTTPSLRGGKQDNISIVNGFNARRLNMVNVMQYRDNSAVYSRDRSWSNDGVSQIGAAPRYTGTDGNSHIAGGCPPANIKHTPTGDVCTYKYSNDQNDIPDLKSFGLMSESNIEVSPTVKMTVRLGGTDRATKTVLAPPPDTITIPKNVANTLGPGGTTLPGADPNQDLDLTFRATQLGNRVNQSQTYAYNALVGSQIELPKDWELDLTASNDKIMNTNKGVGGYALSPAMISAISNHLCNPADPSQPCDLDSARYTPVESMMSEMTSADVKATGEITQMPAGPLSIAIGGTVTYQQYKDQYDDQSVDGNVFGSANSNGAGGRSTRSGYTELSIPIVKSLEAQIAARYDHYSDFGDTVNPKGALLFHASKSVLLRASAGTGFKAPLMQELYAASSAGYPGFIDHVACDRERAAGGPTPECAVEQYKVTSGGNTGLKEERSVSYSTGVVFEPSKSFNISTDVFEIQNKNVVGLDYDDLTLAEAKGIHPSDYGISVTRDANGNITSVNAPLQNLSRQEITGFDISATYRMGKFRLGTEHSQMFWFKEEGFPGAGYRNKLGEHGRPAWRNATTLTYNPTENNDISLVALTTASQEKTDPSMGRIGQYTEWDIMYAYKWRKVGTLMAGVKNVLGTTPPLDDSDPTALLNASIYNPIGQEYYTGYKSTF